jgi:hypothetical protein
MSRPKPKRPEPENRFGVFEDEPELKKHKTIAQLTTVFDGKQWKPLGIRYFQMPTRALEKEIEMYLTTGKQYMQQERIQKLIQIFAENRHKR